MPEIVPLTGHNGVYVQPNPVPPLLFTSDMLKKVRKAMFPECRGEIDLALDNNMNGLSEGCLVDGESILSEMFPVGNGPSMRKKDGMPGYAEEVAESLPLLNWRILLAIPYNSDIPEVVIDVIIVILLLVLGFIITKYRRIGNGLLTNRSKRIKIPMKK